MDKLDYKDFLQKAPIGYAHHRVIFDEANNPIDFIFLEANQKLGEITGLYPNYVIGKKMSDISKNKMATKFDFISYFGNISKNGGSADFEHYAEVSNKWFRVYVTSLKYGYFSLFVSEITSLRDAIIRLDKKKNLLSVFFELSQNLSSFSLEDIIYRSLELAEHQTMSTISFHHFVGNDQNTITKQIWSKNTIDNYCHIAQSNLHNNVEHGIWGKCISTREPLIINNYDTYRESSHTPSGHPHLTRFCILPVIQNELVVAVIGVGNKATDYINEDLESLTEISNTLSSLILQKEYEQKLSDHQTIIELILNNLNSIVYISNIQTYDIIFMNDYGSKVLGGDLIGQKYWDKIFGQTEPCEYCSNKYFSIETELVHNQVSYELFNNKTGIWYEVTDSPIRWHDDRIFKLSVVRDISARKESEQQINDLVHQLQISNNTKDKFFSIIAHDLRNPLGTFMSMAAVLYNDYSYFEENEKLDFLKTMRDSSRNIYNLLENLLDWSSSQSGMIKLKPFPSNLYNLVKTTIDLVTNLATSKSISIINLIPQKLIVNIDPNIISTVIRNLLTNSIKFTPKNGKIEINCINDNGIKLYISDNGIGMDEAKLTNLFNSDLNASSLGTAKEVGSGLGLLLCKDLIEKHKGTISVESTLNQGTTFYINLPWL